MNTEFSERYIALGLKIAYYRKKNIRPNALLRVIFFPVILSEAKNLNRISEISFKNTPLNT